MTANSQNDSHLKDEGKDKFAYSDYVEPLARRLLGVEPPFTLGVFGGWGTGKTSLMWFLKNYINGDQCPQKVVSIWFDAWKFDREEAIWRAFLSHVLNALTQAAQNEIEKTTKTAKQDEIKKFITGTIEPMQEQLFRSFQKTTQGTMQINWQGMPKSLMAIVANSLLSGANLGTSLVRFFSDDDKNTEIEASKEDVKVLKEAMGLIKRQEVKTHFEHIRFLDQFHTEFEQLLAEAKGLLDFNRLVFFIDDLDRCLPENAIQILEAIKLFLSNEHCVFVVGVDEGVIHSGLDLRYSKLFGHSATSEDNGEASVERRQFHQEYLEKIIQLPFTLPPLPDADVRDYLSSRLTSVEQESLTEDQKRMLVGLFATGMEFNPRKLKRVCDLFNLN